MRPMNAGKDPDGIDDRRDLTAGVRLLRAITGDDRSGGGIKRKRFRRGEIVYAIDDLAPGVHVIATGRVKVSRLSGDGREIILRILGKGALFADGRYDSIAETIEATGTTFVANMVVRNRLERDPALGMALFEIAGERLRETQKLAERLAFNPVPSRVRTCCWN